MAIYNEILVGRWNRFIQKLTGIKGGPPSRQLSSEIAFTHDIQTGVENRYLEGWERFGFVITQAALAAQTSDIRFRNPAGSNVIAVFEQVIIDGSGAQSGFIEIGVGNADFTTLVPLTVGAIDSRTRPTPTLIGSRQNNGPFVGAAIIGWATPGIATPFQAILTSNQELTLLPGSVLTIDSQTVNMQLQISAMWRERFLEDSERT